MFIEEKLNIKRKSGQHEVTVRQVREDFGRCVGIIALAQSKSIKFWQAKTKFQLLLPVQEKGAGIYLWPRDARMRPTLQTIAARTLIRPHRAGFRSRGENFPLLLRIDRNLLYSILLISALRRTLDQSHARENDCHRDQHAPAERL